MSRSISFAAALLVTIAASTTRAAVLRVPGDYPTIQMAIDNSEVGDVVLVAQGTYQESLDIASGITVAARQGATITSSDPLAPTIWVHNTGEPVILAGLDVVSPAKRNDALKLEHATDVEAQECVFTCSGAYFSAVNAVESHLRLERVTTVVTGGGSDLTAVQSVVGVAGINTCSE